MILLCAKVVEGEKTNLKNYFEIFKAKKQNSYATIKQFQNIHEFINNSLKK